MGDLQGFLSQASQGLGVSSDSTRSATAALLGLIQQQAGKDELGALVEKIPGAAALVEKPQTAGGGGLLGGLGKLGGAAGDLGSTLGSFGKLGGAASVLGSFQESGLDVGQAGKFVTMFFAFAKSQAGSEVVGKILGKMPELQKLMD